jgi:hypothetical protein
MERLGGRSQRLQICLVEAKDERLNGLRERLERDTVLLVACAIPLIQGLGNSPVVPLKALEFVIVLRVNAQILLDTLVGTEAQKAPERV